MRLIAFAPSTDLDRSRSFYTDVLGLTVQSQDAFACVLRSGDVMLRVTAVGEFTPQPFTILGWDVDRIDAEIARLGAAGIRFNRYDGLAQDENGVWTAPGGDRIAWFADPDGNTLSLTQFAR
jgi:catechol 2,3-dioxygenase-like lactoylglutathione lyase family enzyme